VVEVLVLVLVLVIRFAFHFLPAHSHKFTFMAFHSMAIVVRFLFDPTFALSFVIIFILFIIAEVITVKIEGENLTRDVHGSLLLA
jgi:uncharacterized membrane protein